MQLSRSSVANLPCVRVSPKINGCKLSSRPQVVSVRSVSESGSTAAAKPTLYEKLGGRDAVKAAVDIFYSKVLADDRVKDYFKNTDMAKQKGHQAAFMAYAFGGPNDYKGKDMAAAHRHLIPHLEESHFNAIVENFVGTLKELGVSQADIDEAVAVVATTKDAVLSD